MIIVCPSCQSRYRFEESKLGDRPRARTRCTKCGGSIEIENPLVGAVTLPPVPPSPPQPEPTPEPPAPPDGMMSPILSTQKAVAIAPAPTKTGELGNETVTGRDIHRAGLLELPKDRRFSLAIIQGAGTGYIHPISSTRTVIGRAGSDLVVDDPECSRQHASVEIVGETYILRDLDSTNGTYVDMDRIEQFHLSNQMEFRIGSHVLMFIVTEVE